jgi:hypothetical protein
MIQFPAVPRRDGTGLNNLTLASLRQRLSREFRQLT